MNKNYLSVSLVSNFANDNDAFIPEIWAQEGLAILEENMVAANLVHRDFEDEIARFGDVVNTRRPGTFKMKRKVDGGTLVQQSASATNVRVPLDQWIYNSFTINDGEGSKSFQELVTIYLRPAMQAIARGVDRIVLGQIHQFLGTPAQRVGRLGALSSTNSGDTVLDARQVLNVNKAYAENRNLCLSPSAETALLKNSQFISAEKRGDGGSALERAQLGHILGFDTFMAQNVNSVSTGADTLAMAVTDALAADAAVAAQNVSTTGTQIVVTGEFLSVAGNDQPTYITAHHESGSDTDTVTLNEANKFATVGGAVATRFVSCLVNHPTAGTYAAGWSLEVNVDTYTSGRAPQVGQLIAFGTGGNRRTYTVIESTDNGSDADLILDRPLEVAVANNDAAFPGPYGSFNWAFHRDALALVTRPLAAPPSSRGVDSFVASYNNVSMRVTMQYDIQAQGTVVALDILAGVAVLDPKLCVVLQG